MLIILPRSADNRGSPDAAARSTGNPQSPPGNPQERIPSPLERTFTFVAVALRRLLAAQTDRNERLREFPHPAGELEQQN
jgi:hypothetical protein